MSSYYKKELALLGPTRLVSVQFRDGENATKWMSINPESIEAIKEFLDGCWDAQRPVPVGVSDIKPKS